MKSTRSTFEFDVTASCIRWRSVFDVASPNERADSQPRDNCLRARHPLTCSNCLGHATSALPLLHLHFHVRPDTLADLP